MKKRSEKKELLDDPGVSADIVEASLDFMVRVNRHLGGTKAVLDYFDKIQTPEKFSVLDLGSGSGDIPFALVNWARKKGKVVSVTALDLNPQCRAYAQKHFKSDSITYLAHSAFDLETLGLFDYIISSMFFHHLTDDSVIRLLNLIHRNSRRGFLVNDLYRCRRNHWGAFLLGALTFKHAVRHDAALSVQRAFREKDFIFYRNATRIPFHIQRKPLFRITMSHDKYSD